MCLCIPLLIPEIVHRICIFILTRGIKMMQPNAFAPPPTLGADNEKSRRDLELDWGSYGEGRSRNPGGGKLRTTIHQVINCGVMSPSWANPDQSWPLFRSALSPVAGLARESCGSWILLRTISYSLRTLSVPLPGAHGSPTPTPSCHPASANARAHSGLDTGRPGATFFFKTRPPE